jgi:putative membrane protein
MWGCDFTPMSGGWWAGFFPGGLLSLLFWGSALFLIAYIAIRLFKHQAHGPLGSSRDRIDSLAIIKARFARGEISREEFIKMRQILLQP